MMWRSLRIVGVAFCGIVLAAGLARAGSDDGLAAYARGDYAAALA